MQDYLSLTKLQHRFNPKFHLNILYTLDGLKWDSHSLKKRANVPVCLHNHGQVRGYTSYGCVTVHAPCTKTDVKYEKKEEEKPFINLIPLLICERPSSSAFPGPRRRQEDNLGRWYSSARPSRRRSCRHRRHLLQRHQPRFASRVKGKAVASLSHEIILGREQRLKCTSTLVTHQLGQRH